MRPTIASSGGMTLLEIMVVMVILGMIASMVGVAVLDQLETAKMRDAKIQIQNFSSALDLYKLDNGNYPSTSEGLQSLVTPPNNKNPYLKSVPKDPWGGEYVYISPGTNGQSGFDIETYGADGADGGGDDVESWNLDKI